MATVKILIEKGVLAPPPAEPEPTNPESGEPPLDEGQRPDQFSGILDCRPRTAYVAVIDGGKSEKVSTPTPSGKAE
jgi:hypothetical protein